MKIFQYRYKKLLFSCTPVYSKKINILSNVHSSNMLLFILPALL